MYNTTTGTYQAILTRYGRQVLADNSEAFKITKYMFSDDEIDYSQFVAEDSANDIAILNTPILEPCSLGNSPAQRYSLVSLGSGAQQVSRLDSDWGWIAGKPTRQWIDGYQETRTSNTDSNGIPRCGGIIRVDNGEFRFSVRTLYGYDSKYNVISSNPEIIPYSDSINLLGTYPCPDPYEVKQQQSQAGYLLHIAPSVLNNTKPVTQASAPKYLWDLMEPLEVSIAGMPPTKYRPDSGIISLVGICGSTLTIQGLDTGNKIFIDILIYDPNLWKLKQ